MSQRGKRNYRPNRLNDNQTDKNTTTEEEITEDVVEETVIEELEPEIKTDDIVEQEVVEEFKEVNKIKKLVSQPQIVKPEPQLSGAEWIEQVRIAEIDNHIKEVNELVEQNVKKEVTEDWIQKAVDTDVQINGEAKQQVKKPKNKVTVKEKKEKIKDNTKKPHYVYGRDNKGKTVRVDKAEVVKMELDISEKKLNMVELLFEEVINSILKQEIEIDIIRKMRDKENNLQKIEILDKRIEIFNSQLDDLKLRRSVLEEMRNN